MGVDTRLDTRQYGGVMVFVAASLVVLVSFIAYVVDLNAVLLARERAQQFARFAALAAVEGYFSTACASGQAASACYDTRKSAALTRANQVSSSNRLFNPAASLTVTWDGGQNSATLIPGRWVTVERNTAAGQPECGGAPPCFVANISETSANAFKVEGAYRGGISGFFSQVFMGGANLKFSASAVATAVPRRGIFLVDISRSTTTTTHLSAAVNDIPASEYAFYIGDGSTFPSQINTYSLLPKERAGSDNDIRVHYRDDYVELTPYTDDNYQDLDWPIRAHHPEPSSDNSGLYDIGSNPIAGATYLLDAYRDEFYAGPEPFQTILEGVTHLVTEMKGRAVPGDKVGIIFYDDKLMWPRIVKLTNDYDYILNLLDNTPVSIGGQTLQESNSQDSTSPFVNAAKHWIFPRVSNDPAGTQTNTQKAVIEAIQQFYNDQQDGVITSDFMVMIGDGMPTCYPVSSEGRLLTDYSQGTREIAGWRCYPHYLNYANAITALRSFVAQRVVPFRLPIHMILVGEGSGPNTIDRVKPDSSPPECYTDAELRAIGLSNDAVRGSEEEGQTFDSSQWSDAFRREGEFQEIPFYQASKDMYSIAALTQGIWAPIRPADPGCVPSTGCEEGKVRTQDPQCRTVEEQIKDAMDTIMGQNPYTVVEVN